MREPKYKFTKDMVNEAFIKMIQEQPEQPSTQPSKPNLLQEFKAKTGLNRIRNERQGSQED